MVFFVSLLIFLRIEQSLSAIHWKFDVDESASQTDDYTFSRQTSVHRGILLSLSADQKHEMCLDCFHAQLYKEFNPPGTKGKRKPAPSDTEGQTNFHSVITDSVLTEGVPQHPLSVVTLEIEEDKSESGTKDLMFACVGINFPYRAPDYESNLFLSYAFRPGWMYSLFPHREKNEASIIWYVGISPKYVEKNQLKLEDEYIRTRKTLRTLEEESPEYIKWVERKDDLSELTEKQVRFLCASILATPTYREDGLEFSLKWITDDQHTINYVEKLLAFNNRVYNMKVWRTECALCKAFVDGDNDDGDYTNLYFTRTYDDKNSVLVWKERNGKIFLSKYFKDIHILKNVHENIDDRMLREYQYISERVYGNESTDEILIES